MAIIAVRIDDRLIHGQVAALWTNTLGATRIMVVDDKVATNDVQKMSLKIATPNGVALSVLSIDKAAERITAGAYEGQRVFLVARKPGVLNKLIDKGVELKEINVGNMPYEQGKIKVANTVSVTQEEIEDFEKLQAKGVAISIQLTPSDPRKDFMEVLKEAK